MDGCPLGLGLVVEDKPTEFSYREREKERTRGERMRRIRSTDGH